MQALKNILSFIQKIFSTIFGNFSYTAPAWLKFLFATKKRGLIFISAVFVIGAGYFWLAQPDKNALSYSVKFGEPRYETNAKGEPTKSLGREVLIEFYVAEGASDGKFAALDKVGEVLNADSINAKANFVSGLWRWQNERTLSFMPNQAWLANSKYKVKLDKSWFNPKYKLKQNLIIQTPQLEGKINDFYIYTNPQKPSEKTLSATIEFNYPIAKQDFGKFIKLDKDFAKELKLEFSQNNFGNKLFVKSSPLKFGQKERVVRLEVQQGIVDTNKTSSLSYIQTKNLAIPSIYSFFRIEEISTKIIGDEKDTPKQNLILDFSDAVNLEHLKDKMQVWILPKNRHWDKESIATASKNYFKNQQIKDKSKKQFPELNFDTLPKLAINLNPSSRDINSFASFNFNEYSAKQLLVRLPASLESASKFKLSLDADFVLNIAKPSRKIAIAGKSWLAFNGDRAEILIKSLGADKLYLDLAELNRKDLIQVLTQTRGNLSNLDFTSYTFSEDDIGEHKNLSKRIYTKSNFEMAYTRWNLAEHLKARSGFFVVKTSGRAKNSNWEFSGDKKLVFITNLGLIAKRNSDGTQNIYAHSLKTNSSVSAAKISVYSRSGSRLFSTTTNAEGVAKIPKIQNNRDANQPVIFTIEKDGDFAFLPFQRNDRQINLEDFNTGGSYKSRLAKMRALIFSDRGLYRPGEKINLGVLVKNMDFTPLREQVLELIIRDSQYNTSATMDLPLNAKGFFSMELETGKSDATGLYSVILREKNSRKLIGSTSFRVEEFTPASMELTSSVNLENKAWLKPADLKIEANLKTLYGMGVEDHNIKGKYVLYNLDFSFKEYPNFIFKNNLFGEDLLQDKLQKNLDAIQTDKNGKAEFNFAVDVQNLGLYAMSFTASTLDNSNSLTSKNMLYISAADKLLGYKTSANLTSIKKSSVANLEFVLIDRDLTSLKTGKFKVKLYEKRKVSSLVKQENGNLAYQSIDEEKLIKTMVLDLAKKSTISLPTKISGDFVLKVENALGVLAMQIDYAVLGENGTISDTDNIALKTNKNIYDSGEVANLYINAPYSGLALISLECDKVIKHQWANLKAGKQKVAFRLPTNTQGSMYINTMLVRDLASANTISEPLSYIVKEIYIKPTKNKLNLDLQAPTKVRAGQSFTLKYKADEKSKVIIYAVDEGILQVAKYKMPKPLQFFYPKLALEVQTQQMADLIMPGMNIMLGMPSGAGYDEEPMELAELAKNANYKGAKSMARSNLNPLLAQVKKPVVFWFDELVADIKTKELKINLPKDFTGRLRIMAVAANHKKIGSAEIKTNAIAPLIINSNLVNYMAKGDSAEFSLSIRNGELDKNKKDISLKIIGDDLLDLEQSTFTKFDLKAGEEKIFRFRAKSKNIGVSQIKFLVQHKQYQTQNSRSISIRPLNKYKLQMQIGMSNAAKIPLSPHGDILPNLAYTKVKAARSFAPLMQGLQSYLQNFEHDCTEQLVSKIYPVLPLIQNSETNKKDYLDKYNKLLNILEMRSLPDGGFALWSNGYRGDYIVSMYVINFLLDAKQAGLNTRSLEKRASNLLFEVVKKSEDAYLKSYALYLLARQKVNIFAFLADFQKFMDENQNIKDWHTTLIGAYTAAAWQLMGNTEYADFIYNYNWQTRLYRDFAKVVDLDNNLYISENAQYLYLVAKHFADFLPKIEKSKLASMLEPLTQGKINTLTAGFIAAAFGNMPAGEQSENKIELWRANKKVKFGSTSLNFVVAEDAKDLSLKNPSKDWLFYSNEKLGFIENAKAFSKGLEISQTFYNADGDETYEFMQGDSILVKIKIRSADAKAKRDIAITNMLAGGVSLHRNNLENLNSGAIKNYDLREDRLNIYLDATQDLQVFTYKVKAVAVGEFEVPPIYAESMYEHEVAARDVGKKLVIKLPNKE